MQDVSVLSAGKTATFTVAKKRLRKYGEPTFSGSVELLPIVHKEAVGEDGVQIFNSSNRKNLSKKERHQWCQKLVIQEELK